MSYNKYFHQLLFACLLAMGLPVHTASSMQVKEIATSSHEKLIELSIPLSPHQSILKQTLSISVDNPNVHIDNTAYSAQSSDEYLSDFSTSKEIFKGSMTISVTLSTSHKESIDAHVHISFLLLPDSIMIEKIIPVSFNEKSQKYAHDHQHNNAHYAPAQSEQAVSSKSFTQRLQEMVQATNNNWIRFLLAFFLGLLLSLTPCIYPMIPITIGVLNRNGNQSIISNFARSLCYACGLSTTFACLGLLAAFAGASFGSLLSNPIFVIALIMFIGYMSLTMIGVIDLTIPQFLQRNSSVSTAFNPFLSAYLFGLISGSVASPCVSPGLALLLTMVATMGNIFAGFCLLFMFGIGISVPLMIIGTFSSSMHHLPRAGQWMVEIKKLLGFVMLATCFYYLSNIMPANIVYIFFTIYLICAALFYIIDAQKDIDKKTKTIKSLLGIVLLAISVYMTCKIFESKTDQGQNQEQGVAWADSYQQALIDAQSENKLILLDFWANHCTICKAIEKKIFHKDIVAKSLQDSIIFVKVDCTHSSDPHAAQLKAKFAVFAQPAILIIDPKTEVVLKKWSSEPYSMTPEEFAKEAKEIRA